MKRKNVIFIAIDELTYGVVDKELKVGLNTTPFLSELSKKSIVATKMYAQGPYTEMAIRGLLYGKDGLDDLHTMFSRPSHEPAFYKNLKENDYTVEIVTNFLYQPSVEEDTHYSQMHKNDTWKSLCSTRFLEFEKAILNGSAKEYEFKICFELLELKFINMIALYKKLYDNDESTRYFQKNFSQNKEKYLLMHEYFIEERAKLHSEKETYIVSFFSDKRYKEFDQKESFIETQYMKSDEVRTYAIKKHRSLTKLVKRTNFKLNLKNSRISGANIRFNMTLMRRGHILQAWESMRLLLLHYSQLLTDKYICKHKEKEIIGDSTRSVGMFKHFFEFIDGRDDSNPFFFYMQPTDIHVPADIFNVQAEDTAEVDREYEIAETFVKSLPSDFKGSVNYYTTARILDERVKNFFGELEKRNMLDDSYVIFTSDHGTSCFYEKVRDVMDNTSYDAQYHVPFMLYGKDIVPQRIDKLTYSKDVAPTVLSILGMDIPKHFTGNNILDNTHQNKYIIHEYMGGGCPNFYQKPARFFIRNLEYKVSYWVKLGGEFKDGELKEIHDLTKDPLEINNLIYSKYDKTKVDELLSILEKRHAAIHKEFKSLKT